MSPTTSDAARAPRTPPSTLQYLAGLARVIDKDRPLDVVTMPWTGEPLGHVPRCAPADVEAAIERARAAQPHWAARPLGDRTRVLRRLYDLLLAEQDTMLDIIQLESGKARLHAFEEVGDTALVARYYALRARSFLRPQRRRGLLPWLTRVREYHHPLGVVGLIAPWNYPLSMAVTDALPALAAGNAVILKPAETTPFTALQAADLLYRAGLPADLFQVVTGSGPELGPTLIGGVDGIAFTGSTETGRLVAAQAAERLIPASFELGGKNPMLVLRDADLDRAVEGAVRGCFASAGQLCISIERIYVAHDVYEPFVRQLVERVRRLRIGAGFDLDLEMGSLTSHEQMAKVEAHVNDATEKGARVRTGGHRLPDLGPLFYAPTLLTDVRNDMRVAREETFGPVVSIHPFGNEEEAVAMANAGPYGLNASLWTRDTTRGVRLGALIKAGTVNVNEAYGAAWGSVDAPMGGVRDSGLGRRHGAPGILKYTELQTIAIQRLLPVAPPPGVAPDRFVRLFTRLLKLIRDLPGV